MHPGSSVEPVRCSPDAEGAGSGCPVWTDTHRVERQPGERRSRLWEEQKPDEKERGALPAPGPSPQGLSELPALWAPPQNPGRAGPRGPPLTVLFLLAGNLDITPDDPRWIGAWWGGFLLCGALLFFSSLLMFGFPQSLPPHSDPAMESEQAMLPERDYERPKPSNGVLRHPLEPDSSASCCQQLRGKGPGPWSRGQAGRRD